MIISFIGRSHSTCWRVCGSTNSHQHNARKKNSLPQPTHNSGTMNVPLHEDSMTDSSGSSDDDQVLFDIMESHDDNHNNIVCLCSMFVMECLDEDEVEYDYEHKWGGSRLRRRKRIEHDFQGSFEKLEKQYFNGESSTYTEEQFERRFHVPRVVFAEVWGKVEGKGSFKQHYDCVTNEPGIHPLVRMVACW